MDRTFQSSEALEEFCYGYKWGYAVPITLAEYSVTTAAVAAIIVVNGQQYRGD